MSFHVRSIGAVEIVTLSRCAARTMPCSRYRPSWVRSRSVVGERASAPLRPADSLRSNVSAAAGSFLVASHVRHASALFASTRACLAIAFARSSVSLRQACCASRIRVTYFADLSGTRRLRNAHRPRNRTTRRDLPHLRSAPSDTPSESILRRDRQVAGPLHEIAKPVIVGASGARHWGVMPRRPRGGLIVRRVGSSSRGVQEVWRGAGRSLPRFTPRVFVDGTRRASEAMASDHPKTMVVALVKVGFEPPMNACM